MSAGAYVLLSYLLLSPSAMSLLFCCDTTRCPENESGTAGREVGNATPPKAIGTANFTTGLESKPITWNAGLQGLSAQRGSSQVRFNRNDYLGTLASLHLTNSISCALLFEGIAGYPNVRGRRTSPSNFTCADVLSQRCLSDLLAQVGGEV